MKPARNEAEILADLDKTALEIAQITPRQPVVSATR